MGPTKPTDEILEELVTKQSELKSVCEFNKKRLQHVRELAVKEMKRQEAQRQLEEVDSDIMKSLHTLQSTKQRRRHISDKDRDTAKRALERRKQILRTLESLE
jgi:polyribonucleotide nucleotidyltransferase